MPMGSRMPSWLSTMYSRGKHVEDLAVGVDRDGARALEDALDVAARHLAARRWPRRRRRLDERTWLPPMPA